MNHLILFAVILIATPLTQIIGKEMDHDSFRWTVAKGGTEKEPFFIRFAEIDGKIKRKSFPHRLNVFWTLRAPNEYGLPTEADHAESGAFEERIVEAIERDGHSILCMTLTGKGQKEYVFYTSDPNLFLQALTEMPQEEEKYPIEIIHNEDESWDYFERVLGDVKPMEAEQDSAGQRR